MGTAYDTSVISCIIQKSSIQLFFLHFAITYDMIIVLIDDYYSVAGTAGSTFL